MFLFEQPRMVDGAGDAVGAFIAVDADAVERRVQIVRRLGVEAVALDAAR